MFGGILGKCTEIRLVSVYLVINKIVPHFISHFVTFVNFSIILKNRYTILQDGTWNDYTCENPQSGFICKTPKALKPNGSPQANVSSGCSVVSFSSFETVKSYFITL